MADEDSLDEIIGELATPENASTQENDFLFNAKKREETLKVVIHYITISAIFSVFIVVLIVFFIRVAHFIMPINCHWLSDIQLQNIDKFFFSGAVGGLLTKHMGKLFSAQSD